MDILLQVNQRLLFQNLLGNKSYALRDGYEVSLRCIKKVIAEDKYYVHCAGGYRSMIASSILKSRGIHNIIDVAGGFKAIK